MIAEVCVGAAWPFLLAAAVLRLRPVAGPVRGPARERPLTPVGIGLLRGGGRGAAQTALVELHLAGSVEGAWAGMVRRDDTRPPPPGASGLARAQYSVLFGKLHPSRLQRIGRVERALAAEARAVERAGLLLSGRRVAAVRILLLPVLCAAPVAAVAGRLTAPWLLLALLADGAALALGALPRRTRGGAALLARLRREHAGVRRASMREPDQLLLSVALFGAPALREQLPRFTGESGLLTRPPREPMDRGGSGSGEPFAPCGG